MIAFEVNFDGLVGPTHNYAGLSYGNLASLAWKGTTSNPKAAALEGLAKMRVLAALGIRQAVLPPQERPDVAALRALGFSGSDAQVLERTAAADPVLLAACSSASAMWAANAATVSPSADTTDGRVHFTPANLVSHVHRSLETPTTTRVLRSIFADPDCFVVHPALPAATPLGDEGAANHLRLAPHHGEPGVELFVYGRQALDPTQPRPSRYPARQTLEACAAIARRHGLAPHRAVLLQQDPAAVDAGAFHCDVVAVANLNVMLCHAAAFRPADRQRLSDVCHRAGDAWGRPVFLIEAGDAELSQPEAISSYVFNSQLVSRPDGGMTLVAPAECQASTAAARFIDRVIAAGTPVDEVRYVEVRQSMCNGGGPACLRLRVVLTDRELSHIRPSVLFNNELDRQLTTWVERHYRDSLDPADLADPKLLEEGRTALDELTRMLCLGPVYSFQHAK